MTIAASSGFDGCNKIHCRDRLLDPVDLIEPLLVGTIHCVERYALTIGVNLRRNRRTFDEGRAQEIWIMEFLAAHTDIWNV